MINRTGIHRLLSAALAVCLLSGCGDLLVDEQKLMAYARGYIDKREFSAAAIELRNILQRNPENAEARYLLANISLDYGDFQGAEKEYRRAEAAGWDSWQTRVGIARAMLGMAQFDAMGEVTEIGDDWPTGARAEMLALRAAAEAGEGDMSSAGGLIGRAEQLAPTAFQVMKTGVQLEIIGGQPEQAGAALATALQRYPDNQELLLLQGNLGIQKGDSAAAQEAFARVVALDPKGFISVYGRNARLQLAQLQILASDHTGAADSLRPLFARDPNDPFANYLGAMLAFHTGDFQRAEELLLKVLKVAPDHNPSRLLFGAVNFAVHNYEQAAYFLSKYLLAVPDNLAARKLLARSYILLDRAEEATRVLESAMKDDSADTELQLLAGLSELGRGKTPAGIADLKRVLQVNPGDTATRTMLARAYLESGDATAAIRELKSMLNSGDSGMQTQILLVHAHLNAGEYDAAIAKVIELTSDNPQAPLLQALAGTVFASSGDRDEARRYLRRALELDPRLPPAILALAHLDEISGDLGAATAGYRRLVDMKMESALPMLALARVAETQGDLQAMVEWLERASEHAPGDIKSRMILANYYLNNKLPERALAQVEAALMIRPFEPQLLSLHARVLMVENRYRQALDPLNALIKAAPDSVAARVQLADALINLLQFAEARRHLERAGQLDANNVSVLALMVKLELQDGRLALAREYSSRLRLGYPELYLGYELTGDVLMTAGEYDAAEQEYALASERLRNTGLVIKRAENAVRSGKAAAATGFLQDWLVDHPDDVLVAQHLGVVWENMQQDELAIKQYRAVLELQSDNVVALNNLAGLLKDSDPDRALNLAEQAWRVAPDNPGVQDTYGWMLVTRGYHERGLRLLEKAVKALQEVPEVRYHHAAALIGGGDPQRGRQLLQQLLDDQVDFDGLAEARRLLAGG